MDLTEAFQIVLDLARQNIIDDQDLPEENARQVDACDIVEDFVTNNFGDD